jgi:subtilisin family serine protease
LGCSAVALAPRAEGDVDARRIARLWIDSPWAKRGARAAPHSVAPDGRLRVLVENAPATLGAVPVARGFAAFSGTPEEIAALPNGVIAHFAPPRRPLLNLANNWIKAGVARNLSGLSGKGVVVGIVDTGFDPRHPDFRDADGKTRVAWVLDLSRNPTGKHPDLERSFACDSSESPCAVFSAAELDDMIAADSKFLPRDAFGHGTHVASLAAGNGRSTNPPKYSGVAPDATLVIVRVTRSDSGSIFDPDVVLATRFIFDRADALAMPAVVNLSLGSDFGGHDGSAALERSLGTFVGDDAPGRAIVVAAGNSAGVYSNISKSYPGPFGIHTEVHVPRASEVHVPILTPPVAGGTTRASVFVWIASRPGDALRVGLDDADGEVVPVLGPGESGSVERDGLTASVLNQDSGESSPIPAGVPGAVVVLDGSWPSGETFAVRLEGRGSASLWVQSEGDLTPGASGTGALFPRALKEGTIGIPATGADLIAVGATLNRSSWVDRNGLAVRIESFGSLEPKDDSAAFFSGVGPNALGTIKPDISAPGAFVIGAMSVLVDPALSGGKGLFAGTATCGEQKHCLVVDDFHAVTSGTSMAAPMAAGVIALLLEKDPTLTQRRLLALLQAGARRAGGDVPNKQQLGPGVLNAQGSLEALDADPTALAGVPIAEESWLVLSSALARPDPKWELGGLAAVRKQDGQLVDGFDPARLRLSVERGAVTAPLQRVAPGLWRFSVAAPAGSGGERMRLSLRFDGEIIAQEQIAIAVDPWAVDADPSARGGCSTRRGDATPAWVGLGLPLLMLWRRRRRHP